MEIGFCEDCEPVLDHAKGGGIDLGSFEVKAKDNEQVYGLNNGHLVSLLLEVLADLHSFLNAVPRSLIPNTARIQENTHAPFVVTDDNPHGPQIFLLLRFIQPLITRLRIDNKLPDIAARIVKTKLEPTDIKNLEMKLRMRVHMRRHIRFQPTV